MELRQLEYFVAVAEEANFTRAAERVHISQSGVSAQVKALETELGAALFDRSGRVARLTPAGEAALPLAREALNAASSIREVVDDVNGLVRGRLTAGMITGCEVKPWFEALAAFHGAHPGIEIELQEGNSDRLIASVLTGLSDIALVGIAGAPPPGLASEIIVAEGLAAIVAPDHPLAARKSDTANGLRAGTDHPLAGHKPDTADNLGAGTDHPEASRKSKTAEGTQGASGVSLTELTAYPLVCLPVGTGIRSVLDQACADAGLIPDIALEASAPGAVADLGSRGLGVAVLSRSMAAGYPDLVSLPITGIDIPALLALVWRPKPSPATTALLTQCRRTFTPSP